jgi:hypothetical protein
MRQLRQLHLQLALETARTLGKYIQNQPVAVQYAATRELLEIAFLAGCQGLIHEHDVGIVLVGGRLDLLRLARTDEILRVRSRPSRQHQPHLGRARGGG